MNPCRNLGRKIKMVKIVFPTCVIKYYTNNRPDRIFDTTFRAKELNIIILTMKCTFLSFRNCWII